MEKSLDDVKKIFDPKTFKYEILICFWLCIHLERLELAQIVLEQDSIMERVLVNMRKAGKEYLEAEKEKNPPIIEKKSLRNKSTMNAHISSLTTKGPSIRGF